MRLDVCGLCNVSKKGGAIASTLVECLSPFGEWVADCARQESKIGGSSFLNVKKGDNPWDVLCYT